MQNVITYDAVIGVSNSDLKLFPGMTANVKMLVSQRSNVLKVPNAALRYHPASDASQGARSTGAARAPASPEKAVWILDGKDTPQRVVVTTGETDGTFTEVTGGVVEGGRPRDSRRAVEGHSLSASRGPAALECGRGPGF